ncbi:MAG: HAD family phosphatase [candidate division NC10 bacterium]|nr:HAD family phosphatase [candidate division NC10 bacterium]
MVSGLRAMILDFNGVILDDESVHCATMQEVLAEEGYRFTEEEYRRDYLALDDRGAFAAALRKMGRPVTEGGLAELIRRKGLRYRARMQDGHRLFPGVADFLREAAGRIPLAIASGALRDEIETALARVDLSSCFSAIVSAEDVRRMKPDPEIYRKALDRVNGATPRPVPPIAPSQCLAIEDSMAGVQAAQAAGMPCVAVTNSYPAEALAFAEVVVPSLAGQSPEGLWRMTTDASRGAGHRRGKR